MINKVMCFVEASLFEIRSLKFRVPTSRGLALDPRCPGEAASHGNDMHACMYAFKDAYIHPHREKRERERERPHIYIYVSM